MDAEISAHQILAFAIVNNFTIIPYEDLLNLGPTDPLYKALVEAYRQKEERLDARTALICAIIANCMGSGSKKYEIKDFMPKAKKSAEAEDLSVKTMFSNYMASK